MRILLNIMKYDYGKKARGYSYEYESFYRTLLSMGHNVDVFDFLTIAKELGVKAMHQLLLQKIKKSNYDLLFTSLYTNEFNIDFLNQLKNNACKSVVWMNDDQWRWNSLGRKICFCFHNVITTDFDAIRKYYKIGYKNVILSQFGFNNKIFKRKAINKNIDISFVGQPNPWRKYIVDFLKRKGYSVECFGFGWPNGRITTSKMVEVFNRSKINLNLSNSVQYDLDYLKHCNWTWKKNKSFVRNIYDIFGPQLNTLLSPKRHEQIKARIFEITASGGFALTYDVKHLSDYFNLTRDVSVYSNPKELLNKVRYFLKNEEDRERIAESGYYQSLLKHTYQRRFDSIFSTLFSKE
jgi:spore maturation protein CgeB